MKENISDEIKILEFNYDDWWNGKIIVNILPEISHPGYLVSYSEGTILGNLKPGKHLINAVYAQDNSSILDAEMYTYLPDKEWEKINSKQIELYENKVNNELESKKNEFINYFNNKSEEPELLLSNEINNYKKILFENELPLNNIPDKDSLCFPIRGLNFTALSIECIRNCYEKIIIRGKKDYYKIQSPHLSIQTNLLSDYYDIQTEVVKRYLDWLIEFQKKASKNIVDLKPNSGQKLKDIFLLSKKKYIKDIINYLDTHPYSNPYTKNGIWKNLKHGDIGKIAALARVCKNKNLLQDVKIENICLAFCNELGIEYKKSYLTQFKGNENKLKDKMEEFNRIKFT